MSPPSDQVTRTRGEVIQWMQLAALITALVVGSMTLGRKDEQLGTYGRSLDKLESIVTELTRHAVRSEAQTIELLRRVEALERRP